MGGDKDKLGATLWGGGVGVLEIYYGTNGQQLILLKISHGQYDSEAEFWLTVTWNEDELWATVTAGSGGNGL